MKVWTVRDHDSFYPVGAASVVVADSEDMARRVLDEALHLHGLATGQRKPYTLQELPLNQPTARILVDGDY